jgi:ABC-type antimicrobial peptide transport system permease subunit
VRTLEHVVGTSVADRRFATALIGAFASLALLLAGIGIYGVVSYSVSERSFEIGVRMASGAERTRVMTIVLSDSACMALIGIALGMVGVATSARAIRSLLVDVAVIDVPTLLIVSVALVVVAIAATLVPARRAVAVDPTRTLRGG